MASSAKVVFSNAVIGRSVARSLPRSYSSRSTTINKDNHRRVVVASFSRGVQRWMTTYYTPAHEYCKVEGKVATVGITDFAQSALGDIVFVDLPSVDDVFVAGDSIGSVESVKAASDVYAPVGGRVLEVNGTLSDEPGLVNTDSEGGAWFVKLEMGNDDAAAAGELDKLMSEEEYRVHCEKEAH
ncbi:hypothetical protein ACHAW5_004308 [Stephanodiscus triporus]|uniref:Glycine cleavage system H protein n=1 Tax=Stephanodiscus triporus TaxID=2934178 RepID=A0ABD3QGX8_9STRA